jgi:hypothetical protein
VTGRPNIGETIELLACDIESRPKNAPMPHVLVPHLRGIERSGGAVTFTFAPEAADDVEAFAAAESICCAGIGWAMRRDPVTLTITASPTQLDAIQQIFEPA